MIKKIVSIITIAIASSTALFAQTIRNNSPVSLPTSGTFSVGSGQTASIVSARSVTLGPGTTLSSGSSVYIGVNKSLVAPAPNNSADDLLKNWVQVMSYDDDGKEIGATKEFYDNTGKVIQTQFKAESMGHVLAKQPLYDFQGRPVGMTLAAPINSSDFVFKDNFLTNTSGTNYDYKNFDGDWIYGFYSKTNNPDPVGTSTIGSVGWYYSDNNTIEPMVGSTSYPYARSQIFQDGTAMTKLTSGVGDPLKMGSGHERGGVNVPVINELAAYLEIRNKMNAIQPLGAAPVTLVGSALQGINQDANGTRTMVVTDLAGQTLMTARAEDPSANPPAWLTVTNSFTLNQPTNLFKAKVTFGTISGWLNNENNIVGLTILSSGTIAIYKNSVLVGTQAGNYTIDQAVANDNAVYEIQSYQPFYYYYTKTNSIAGNKSDDSTVGNFPAVKDDPATKTMQYFYLTAPSAVTLTGSCSIYEMKTETKLNTFTSGQTLPAGYYKAVVTNQPANPNNPVNSAPSPAVVTYTNKYSDISYQFYNQSGQLIADIQPNGVQAYLLNPTMYSTGFDIPYTNRYEYDSRGRVIAKTTVNSGRSEYIYRRDGHLRFSQNAIQRVVENGNERFSFTNYDANGRPLESGEYVVPVAGTLTFSSAKTNTTLLEDVTRGGGLTGGTKQDQMDVYYDTPATNLSLSGYTQDEGYLKSNVSWTQNGASTTWYNYDSQGRIIWTVKKLTDMPVNAYKTTDYTYDPSGHAVKVDYQRLNSGERFVHYYDYNTDGKLTNVQTSRDDITKVQQSSYSYYLQGSLKRVEIADNLQGIDYTYTPQGWLKSINSATANIVNDPGGDGASGSIFAADAFGMQSEYFPGDYNRTGSNITSVPTGQNVYYDSNINGISWQTKPSTAGFATPSMYTYKYDRKYQFTDAIWGTPNYGSAPSFTPDATGAGKFKEYGIGYDANGNIKSLLRTNLNGVLTDNYNNYQYQAGTDKLLAVGSTSVPGSYATYTYDLLGQLKSQVKGANGYYFKYNVSGKIVAIYTNPGLTGIPVVSYSYDEVGNRIKSVNSTTTSYYIYDAKGNVLAIYTGLSGTTLSEIPVYGGERIGMYSVSSDSYRYEIHDNVGSVRAVLNRTKVSGQSDIVAYSDFFPYGTKYRGLSGDYRFEYQGLYAEKDNETGYNNFELRMYDARIGRWLTIDPAGQYPSPYEAMGNSPVDRTDPNGDCSPCTTAPPGAPSDVEDGTEYTDDKGVKYVYYDEYGGWSRSLDEAQVSFNGVYAYGPNAGYTGDGYGYSASLFGMGANYSNENFVANIGVQGYGADFIAKFGLSGGELGAKVYMLRGSAKLKLKTKNASAEVAADGSLLAANADLSITLPTFAKNGSQKVGIGAGAGAYVAKGDITGTADIFGIKVSATIGGSVASVHAGAEASAGFDSGKNAWTIDVDENLGFLLGEHGAIHIQVPSYFQR